METKKPTHVSGYIRNKKISDNRKANQQLATILLGGVVILTLAVYWKFTVTIALAISLGVFAKKYYQFANDPSRLMVNYFGATAIDRIRDNIKEMLREQLRT